MSLYWTYAPVMQAEYNRTGLTVKFYKDGTEVISNGTSLRVQFDYNFTEGSEVELNYTQNGILFPHGTRLI